VRPSDKVSLPRNENNSLSISNSAASKKLIVPHSLPIRTTNSCRFRSVPFCCWGVSGNTTLEFPSEEVNSFHSVSANIVARSNVVSASTLDALLAPSF
jgi:hypothetical protein